MEGQQVDAIRDFFGDFEIGDDWFMRHMKVSFDDYTHSMYITVDNINEQEYALMKEGN